MSARFILSSLSWVIKVKKEAVLNILSWVIKVKKAAVLNSFYSKFILEQINKISVLETFLPSLESYCTHEFAMSSSSIQDPSCRNLCRVHFLVQHKGRLGTTWKCPATLLLNWHRNLTAPIFRCGLKCPLIFPDGNLFPSGSQCPGVRTMSHELPQTSQALH